MLIDIFSLSFPKNVRGILHIGAHECEERANYLTKFNNITDDDIIWIDALVDKVKHIKQQFPSVKIYNECISDKDNDVITFNVTNNFQSSSILKLKDHLIEHPDIYEIANIQMKTKTIKTFYQENNFNYDRFNFVALDIQGAELLALKGANDILNNVDYIYIEVNDKELYENCALLNEVDEYLAKFNFARENILMTEHGWGDAFYVKKHFNICKEFKVYYGTDLTKIDVTNTLFQSAMLQSTSNKVVCIPSGEQNRTTLFGDPVYGTLKSIFIESNEDFYIIDYATTAYLNLEQNLLGLNNVPYISNAQTHKLSIMAIFKNETMNLKLWIEHYIWQGVEHFYLIDNGSTDRPLDILQNYINIGVVSYYYREEKYKQVDHYRYIFDTEKLKDKTEWLAICDLDEFFFGTNKPLIDVLKCDFNDYNIIHTNSFFYGCDNHVKHPADIRISNIHRNNDTVNGNKYIFKPKIINDSSEIWVHWLVDPGTFNMKHYEKEISDNTKIRLNHYQIQSLEYYQNVKMTRGDVSREDLENSRTMNIFEEYKQFATIKDEILKNIIENNVYDKNGVEMKIYDENNKPIETPDQTLVNQYILENDVVLELGARCGAVSCRINKKLNNKRNQISVEPDSRVWNALELNKIKNNCNFKIVKGFISNLKSDSTNSSCQNSDIYELNEIKLTYNIPKFTTLVSHCEEYLETFFVDNPEMYEELKLLIFKADCTNTSNYDKLKQNLMSHRFINVLEGHQNVWIKKEPYQLSQNFKIRYGIYENNVDVTDSVYKKYISSSGIIIPDGDGNRSITLGDPLHGVIKSIFVYDVEGSYNEFIDQIDTTKVFVYGDSHGRFNFKHFASNDKIQIFNKQQDNITMHRIARDNLIINFDNAEHDNNSILCFNYGEIDCRCHIKKQIDLGRDENDIINELVDQYFKTIQNNINVYKKIVMIAVAPATYRYDYEKNYGPVTHKHPFMGSDQDRIRYTRKMNDAIKKQCNIYNFVYFDPFLYYSREDFSLDSQYSDGMVHLGNNNYFLDKFYSNVLFDKKFDVYKILHYQQAFIDVNKNELYIGNVQEISKMVLDLKYETIHVKCYDDIDLDYKPNFYVNSIEHKFYRFENVTDYEYLFCESEFIVKCRRNTKYVTDDDNKTYYFVMDCPGLDAFAHWIYECFIFFPIFKELISMFPNIKILTSNKKNYVRNFLDFVEINNEIVYQIDNCNNVCFFPPLISLNRLNCAPESNSFNMFKLYIDKLKDVIENKTHNFNFQNRLVYLPRNLKNNYHPVGKISEELLFERRNQEVIDYISNGVIDNGGIVLETYNINNINIQFSIIKNSKNIILDYGSAFYVNSLALKDKNIIILNPTDIDHFSLPSIKYIFDLCLKNNNSLVVLNRFNSYNDIEKHLR